MGEPPKVSESQEGRVEEQDDERSETRKQEDERVEKPKENNVESLAHAPFLTG